MGHVCGCLLAVCVSAGSIVVAAPPSLSDLAEQVASRGSAALVRFLEHAGGSTQFTAEDEAIRLNRFEAELEPGSGQVILQVSNDRGNDFEYILLEPRDGAWIHRGSVTLSGQRGEMPTHRIETTGDGRWLVIRALRASGTGFSRSNETWYALGEAGLESVLSYPASGHVTGHGLPFDRSYDGYQAGLTSTDGVARLEVIFTAHYTNGQVYQIDGLDHLFSKRGLARFVLDRETGRFLLDGVTSTMTEAQIRGLFGSDAQGFLVQNFSELREMALSGTPAQREWLGRFLPGRDDCTEKTVLMEHLGISPGAATQEDRDDAVLDDTVLDDAARTDSLDD